MPQAHPWRQVARPASSSAASFFAWQRRARNEWLVMNRKGPWEGYRRLSPSRLPLRAHRERRLGTRQWQDHVTKSEIQSRAGTPAYTPYSVSAAWDGWGMVITWMMDASPKKFYKVNWRESGNSGAPLCGSKTHANMTLKHAKLIQNKWENAACDRASWRTSVKEGIEKADVKRHRKADEKRDRR